MAKRAARKAATAGKRARKMSKSKASATRARAAKKSAAKKARATRAVARPAPRPQASDIVQLLVEWDETRHALLWPREYRTSLRPVSERLAVFKSELEKLGAAAKDRGLEDLSDAILDAASTVEVLHTDLLGSAMCERKPAVGPRAALLCERKPQFFIFPDEDNG